MSGAGDANAGARSALGRVEATLRDVVRYTPSGDTIPEETWRSRHRNIVLILLAHVPLLLVLGLYEGTESVTGARIPATPQWLIALELGILLGFVGLSVVPQFPRRARTALASTGLLASSVVLVQFSGGYIEAHFHFFVAMAAIAAYEDWLPFALGLVYVVSTHGVFGMINPERVYNHAAAIANPWIWGLIHGVFVLGLAASLMSHWYSTEKSREQ
ncbi:MAG: methyl-accepting chemotaxis protein, partial [Halobacterium sp.]